MRIYAHMHLGVNTENIFEKRNNTDEANRGGFSD